jgi:hypothetical protein
MFETKQEPITAGGKQTGTRVFKEYRLTNVGHRFMKAVSDKLNTQE